MAYTKSRKIHLRKFRVDNSKKVYYKKWGSACGTADLDTNKIKDFQEYSEKYPKEICKKCQQKLKQIISDNKK